MTQENNIASVATEKITASILTIRHQRVMLDADLAFLYGVSTKQLNQTVRRNNARFPNDFMFKLTPEEKQEVVTKYDHLSQLKYSAYLPHAFTEHGALMLAGLFRTKEAIQASVNVTRSFVRLRLLIDKHLQSEDELLKRIELLEAKTQVQFQALLDTLHTLKKGLLDE